MKISYVLSESQNGTCILSATFQTRLLEDDKFVCRLFCYEKWLYRKEELVPSHQISLPHEGIFTLSVSILRNGEEIEQDSICFEFFNKKSKSRLDGLTALLINNAVKKPSPKFFKFQKPFFDFVVINTKYDNYNLNTSSLGGEFNCYTIPSNFRKTYLVAQDNLNQIKDAKIFYSGSHIYDGNYYAGSEDISNSATLSSLQDNLGGYTMVALQDGNLFFETDYFGMCQLYIYKDLDRILISNRYHALLCILRSMGIELTINIESTLSSLSTLHALAEQPLTNETFVQEISLLEYGHRIIIDSNGFHLEKTGAYHTLEDTTTLDDMEYEQLLKKSKLELSDNLQTILSSSKFTNYTLDLTGGQDSRVAFATLTNLPQELRSKCKISSALGAKSDFAIANTLVDDFGYDWDLSVTKMWSINSYSAQKGIDEHHDLWLSLYMGKGLDPAILNFGIKRLEDALRMNGGSGELYRHFFAKNHVAPLSNLKFSNDEELILFFDEMRRYGEFICDYEKAGKHFIDRFKKRIDEMPVNSTLHKYETLYPFSRNRFHFSLSRDGGYRTLTYLPNLSKCAYRAFHQTFDKFSSRKFIFDLMNEIHSEIAIYPYEDEKNNEARNFFYPKESNLPPILKNIPSIRYLEQKSQFDNSIKHTSGYEKNAQEFEQVDSYRINRILSDFSILMTYKNGIFKDKVGNALLHLITAYKNNKSDARLKKIFMNLYVKITHIVSVIKMISPEYNISNFENGQFKDYTDISVHKLISKKELVDNSFEYVVDLFYNYPINYIVLSGNLELISIRLSENGESWTSIYQGNHVIVDNFGMPFVLPISKGVNARYISFSFSAQSQLSFGANNLKIFIKNSILGAFEQTLSFRYPKNLATITQSINVAILGTSNSIMNGYKDALVALGCNVVKNVSVGSSHSSVIPYRLKELDDVNFDYLIIDIFVNEYRANAWGYDFGCLTEEIFQYLLSWCCTKKVIPIILIMPTDMTDDHSGFLNKYLLWCKNNNIPYFNGFDFIKNLSYVWQRDYRTFFQDYAHLSSFGAKILGYALSNILKHISIKRSNGEIILEQIIHQIKQFSYISLLDSLGDTSFPVVERKSSVLLERFLSFVDGDKIKLNLGSNSSMVGIVLNMAKCNSYLSVTYDNHILIKHLDTYYFSEKSGKDLWLSAWNFHHKINAVKGELLIEILGKSRDDHSIFEYNDNQDYMSNNLIDYDIVAEIAGFIVCNEELVLSDLLMIVGLDFNLLTDFNYKSLAILLRETDLIAS